jgi:ectoine hydroxylase-related dioxygenase (phytanoyl-CoA dioxygenase family)
MVTAFIALQDMDLSNGCMRTITGSHKWGLIEDSNMFFDKDMDKQRENFQAAAKGAPWEDVPTVMKKGQVAFHHCLTLHGSGPNPTATPRMAVAVHIQGEDVRYKVGKWHPNVRELGPLAREGDKFEGPAFPVMYSSDADQL